MKPQPRNWHDLDRAEQLDEARRCIGIGAHPVEALKQGDVVGKLDDSCPMAAAGSRSVR
jgi:hypothetical protein